jgi:diguanylate cyclase (GGDEF)-like protein
VTGWDSLTGAVTRQVGEVMLLRFIQQAGDTWPLSIVFMDVDNLKVINDQMGHNAGDRLLCVMVHNILSNIRRSDELIRWAGDEFILALPNTDFSTALDTIKRIRATNPTVEFSTGIAQWQLNEPLPKLIARADSAMYREKQLHKVQYQINPNWPGINPDRRSSQ